MLRLTTNRPSLIFRRVVSAIQFWPVAGRLARRWLEAHKKDPQRSSDVFARANIKQSSIVETHRFRQALSVNPVLKAADQGTTGRVEIVVPLDGYQYFTRDAIKDVQNQIGERRNRGSTETVFATVGHLVLVNLRDARRAHNKPIADAHGAIRLQMPIRSASLGDDDLVADRQEATLQFDYHPPTLTAYTFPIQLDVEILDPEDSSLLSGGFGAEWGRDISDEVSRQPAFSSELQLMFRVRLAWPRRQKLRKPKMYIKTFSVSWPTVTSLEPRSLRLHYGHRGSAEMQYNPIDRSLQWFDVPLLDDQADTASREGADSDDAEQVKVGNAIDSEEDPRESAPAPTEDDDASWDEEDLEDEGEGDEEEADSGAVWHEQSENMILFVRQPGQLRKESVLTGSILVEVAGQLMSGIEARLFDATGVRHRRGTLTLKTVLDLKFEIFLEDVFNRRPLSATHTLHFDEVVPNMQRVEDINAALRDRGFGVASFSLGDDDTAMEWRIRATRADGPDTIVLSIVVRGRRYQTKRRSGKPGSHRYTSEMESGEMRLAIHGKYPRHSRELTAEVNALRQALVSRFRNMAAQR